ncbi:MAG: peptidylprolyl isomerase [Bacilli bacterium]|nr:peptidylprolyl isomerase [Bacilli bacterium]
MAKEAKKTQTNKKSEKKEDKKVVKKNKVKEEVKVEEKKVKEIIKEDNNKEIKVKKEKNLDKFITLFNKVDNYRVSIILFIVGFLLATLIFRCIFWPDRIATLKDGTQPIATLSDKTVTADDLYSSMKEYYSVNILLNDIDEMILNEKYKENDEMKQQVQSTADYYYQVYEQNYGYTKEQFLSEYGFTDENAFLESLKLDYLRNKYYEEYALSLVTDKEVEKFYEDEAFGDVDSKHILVAIEDDGLTDAEAKALAEEIIGKLNDGTSWDDVVTEYKDKITHEELGYMAFNASLESSYLEECKNLKVGEYSKTPVLTSYGYHIVNKIDQKEKAALDDIKDDIKELIANDKKEADTNLYYKSLINLREEAKLEFTDTVLGDEYKKYVNSYK